MREQQCSLWRISGVTFTNSRQQLTLETLQYAFSTQILHRMRACGNTQCVTHLRPVGKGAHRGK